MTDFSPNVEVVLSSDLFEDDPCFEDMSAPALAVLDAYMTGYGWLDGPTKKDCCGVAAALRAAADQFNSVEAMPGAPFCRNKLLAIANELEQLDD